MIWIFTRSVFSAWYQLTRGVGALTEELREAHSLLLAQTPAM